jgi:hypothetical protein
MDRQQVAAERGQVDDRYEERDRPDTALGDDPARPADPVERDRDPDRRLEPAPEEDERGPIEGGIVTPDRPQRTIGREPVDVLDLDLGRAGQLRLDRTQLAADGGRIRRACPQQADADGAVEIEVDWPPGGLGRPVGQRTKVRMA